MTTKNKELPYYYRMNGQTKLMMNAKRLSIEGKTRVINPEIDGWFKTRDQAIADYLPHKVAAIPRLNEIEERLKHLMELLNFNITFYSISDAIEGGYNIDPCATESEHQPISVTEGGYTFYREIPIASKQLTLRGKV